MDNESFPVLDSSPPRPAQKAKPERKRRAELVAEAPPPPGLIERSIFHEPWWLEAATGGNWGLAEVKNGNAVLGEMPYTLIKRGFWSTSTLPPLTRTLGPVIKLQQKGAHEPDWCNRLNVTRELAAQMPKCGRFHQIMDPHVSEAEAMAFKLQGFKVTVGFTLVLDHEADEAAALAALRRNTRNWVRRAQEHLTVREIDSPEVFVDFYDANLMVRNRNNVYGSATMRRLLGEVTQRKAGKLLGAFREDGTLVAETALLWDKTAVYYFLSSRRADAHGGAVSLLLWEAMAVARERKVLFDFDGVSTAGILEFLGGFGGRLVQRFEIERTSADYAALRTTLHRARALSKAALQRLARRAPTGKPGSA